MTHILFQQAMGLIDDDLISEAATSGIIKNNNANIKNSWGKISLIAACITLIIFISPKIPDLFKSNTEDPNWHKFHTYAYSVDEAVEKFGDDLLLDRLVLGNDYPELNVEFILEHEEGGANNRDTWSDIDVHIRYKDGGLKSKEDRTTLRIFFDKNNPSIDGTEMYTGYRNIFNDGFLITEINGVTIKYKEHSGRGFTYMTMAEFEYNGYIYFLDTFSKDNEEMFWDTIRQMLDEQ